MIEVDGIVGISLFFVLGTAAAALLQPCTDPYFLSAAACALAASGITAFASARKQRLPLFAAFFALGILCFCTASLTSWYGQGLQKLSRNLFSAPLSAFQRSIEITPFMHSSTSALLEALLTGRRSLLGKDIITSFRQSGATHILALSGLHMGVIYLVICRLLAPLGNSTKARITRAGCVITLSLLYVMMTGCGPSITRAFLFIVINELQKLLRTRRQAPLEVFCLALTIQLVITPLAITSAGFQLSYLAMAGIIVLYPVLKDWYPSSGDAAIDKRDPFRRIWNSAALSISCQIFTGGIAWLRFHSFPRHFLLTNLIALPTTELLICLGLSSVLLTHLGICPQMLLDITDKVAQALLFALRIISSM